MTGGLPTLVFVVGTGRCGTESLAKLLDSLPGCHVKHEMAPKLLQETLAYRTGKVSHHEMVKILRETRGVLWKKGIRVVGEAHNRLSFVLPALAEAFPSAKYIHLVRDGRDVVVSCYYRRWITRKTPDEWDAARIEGDKVGDMSTEEWKKVGLFGSTCWFWAYTNRIVREDAAKLGLQMVSCKTEEIDTNLSTIFRFLGLDDIPPLALPRQNITRGRGPMPWRYWSPSQRVIFERLAGAEMDKWYPGWRYQMAFSLGQEVFGLAGRMIHGFTSILATMTRPFRRRF